MTVPLNKWKVARKVEKKTSTCYHSYVHNINSEQDWELSKTFLRGGLHAQSKQKKHSSLYDESTQRYRHHTDT